MKYLTNRGVRSVVLTGMIILAGSLIAPHLWIGFAILGVAWLAVAVFAVTVASRTPRATTR
jgi:hypothetical protein